MAYRPPSWAFPSVKPKMRQSPSPYMFGPQRMNITQPLSRASTGAEWLFQQQQLQQHRKFSSYYYPFPKIPRPKRNVLYYSTWSKGSKFIPGHNNIRFPKLKISRRSISNANQKLKIKTKNLHNRFFSVEARRRRQQRRRFIRWWTVTSLTVVLGGIAAKIKYERGEAGPINEYQIKPQLWHLYAYSTLPLKAMSRLWGQVNSINLPVWLRSPSYRLYSALFGVNLDEMEDPDFTAYPNLSEFFYRTLRPGVRPIDDSDLVSPADGKVLKFGVIENGEIEQVKGMTYSIDALLGLKNERLAAPSHSLEFEYNSDDETVVQRDSEFAKINGISYTVDDIVGGESDSSYHLTDLNYRDNGDRADSKSSLTKEMTVAKNLASSPLEALSNGDKQLFFTVIYLAPGDYHHYHSPTNWVTTLRRHFIGELFSVAPFFQKTLQGLFVLNERVALLGYWKYGFFSMIPVGATNVGSIVVNFDKDLKTNDVYEHEVYSRSASPDEKTPLLEASSESSEVNTIATTESKKKKLKKNTVYEATYSKASRILGGYPLTKGQEMGGFKLGSTVVLIFEAPSNFKFNLTQGQKVKVGESLGQLE
ncbi:phosphatidylserine decarboxylase [Suhomyces tanzawaensis NRRL Y-17324]|uniref:Phosphatidylserine decarboxylase proenzyme 1, mitochondrial n=1 Tax=Suhomyces tanzawaensis NRRL Y-17324 TaxID=984487 RepID=A0A1E4SMS9_9ASCO|nr:phosphatidylserine decarboxylase [Suhomyces tanzawaensis NRRL Y-17324]ODV80796.1 phosphatidylserine decarboxylase [Suhomyces tanzawaensis NRRL Y-17324]